MTTLAPRALLMVVVMIQILFAESPSLGQARPGEHRFVADYRDALGRWMTASEMARVGAIDTHGTDRVPQERLVRLAADHAARVLAPLALDGEHRGDEARRLRALGPLADGRSIARARGLLLQLHDHSPAQATDSTTFLPQCDQPLAWTLQQVDAAGRFRPRAAPVPGTGPAIIACGAIRSGADRVAVVDAVLALLRAMASARQL